MAKENDIWRPPAVEEPAAAYEHYGFSTDVSTLIQRIKEGLSFKAFARLQQVLALTELQLASVLRIPASTLARRKKEGRLASDESERLLRVGRLFDLAVGTFGDSAAAQHWLNAPRSVLDGETPLERAETEPGARQVEALLGRLEFGVYS